MLRFLKGCLIFIVIKQRHNKLWYLSTRMLIKKYLNEVVESELPENLTVSVVLIKGSPASRISSLSMVSLPSYTNETYPCWSQDFHRILYRLSRISYTLLPPKSSLVYKPSKRSWITERTESFSLIFNYKTKYLTQELWNLVNILGFGV